MLEKLSNACQTCAVCFGNEKKYESKLFEFHINGNTVLIVDDLVKTEDMEFISEQIGGASFTRSIRCDKISLEEALIACSVYTKMLFRYFTIIFLNESAAEQLSLQFEDGKISHIENCTVLFGLNCEDYIDSLKKLLLANTRKPLIGG